ncbi:TetR family transcriptional regulator [Streptomyces sp. NPDC127119]|uniref:TetR/AcrR family transcriptional regulator n=1 Tax=Streptomyces sp. NPDC127119 TaxID=3345370 RepID=UPI00363947F1
MDSLAANDREEPQHSSGVHARAGVSGRTGRRPGNSGTREAILRAARRVFSERSYSTAKMRDIAGEAEVNTALIHHFFENKEGVFLAAIQDVYRVSSVLDQVVLPGPRDELGMRFLSGYMSLWQDPVTREQMLMVVRSAVSNDEAGHLMASFIRENVIRPVVGGIDTAQPELRATLIGSQFVGIAVIRYIIKLEPLASMDNQQMIDIFAPTIQRYLTADIEELRGPYKTAGQSFPGRDRKLPGIMENLFLEP